MVKIPLREQVRAVDRALGIALRHGLSGEDATAIGAALKALSWLDRNADLVREIVHIETYDAVKELRASFPGAKLVAVRSVENGSEESQPDEAP